MLSPPRGASQQHPAFPALDGTLLPPPAPPLTESILLSSSAYKQF